MNISSVTRIALVTLLGTLGLSHVPSRLLTVSQYAEMTDSSSGSGDDAVNDVAVDTDGFIYVTGYFTTGSGTSSFATMSYTDVGTDAWSGPDTFTGTASGLHVAVALALDQQTDRLYVTGYSKGSGTGYDIVVIKYAASSGARSTSWSTTGEGNGVRRWNYSGVDGDDVPVAILADPGTENVFVLGTSYGGSTTHKDYVLVKYDSNGNIPSGFPVRYDAGNSGDDEAADMAFGLSGISDAGESDYVYVTGASYGGSSELLDYLTIKYSKSTGSVASGWPKRYSGAAHGTDRAVAIATNTAGAFVTGYVTEVNNTDTPTGVNYLTIAYNTDGSTMWANPVQYDSPAATDSDIPTDIAVDASYVWVTGYSTGTSTGLDFLTVKYAVSDGSAPTGWTNGIRRDGGSSLEDRANELAVFDGEVYVTGFRTASSPGNADFVTLKYKSDGTEEWYITFPTGGGSGNDHAYAIALDHGGTSAPNPNPKPIVGGSASASGSGFNFKTIKYRQD